MDHLFFFLAYTYESSKNLELVDMNIIVVSELKKEEVRTQTNREYKMLFNYSIISYLFVHKESI